MHEPLRIGALTAGCVVFISLGASVAEAPVSRAFRATYTASFAVPAGAKRVELWMPYPESDDHQTVSNVRVSAPAAYEVTKGQHGNAALHLRLEAPEKPAVEVSVSFDVRRAEYRRADLRTATPASRDDLPADVAQWLQPEKRVPLDATIRKLAETVTAGQHTDFDKAQAIYDYVVKTMSYDKSGTGWGQGDIYWACDAKRGNCTDFHALFTGLARAVGIPARFEIGYPLPPQRSEGKATEVAGYHCWAEFYLRGYGWVPVDASEGKKQPEKRDYFFGALDVNRVQLSIGRDLVLTPRQAGDPLNYFVYPYVEADGKPVAGVGHRFEFEDLAAGRTSAR